MQCSCTISVDHEGGPDCFSEEIRTARKTHKCCECSRGILPGEKYEDVSGCWEGSWGHFKTCMDCKSIRDVFFDSFIYTQVWDNFHDEFCGEVVPESCIAELTPGARAKVCELIEEYWEDE